MELGEIRENASRMRREKERKEYRKNLEKKKLHKLLLKPI